MPLRLPSLTLLRLWAVLVLAAIGLQAAEPIPAPLEARHGSAFGATTYEVAIAPQRRAEAAQAAPILPPLVPVRIEPVQHALSVAAPADMPALRPDSTGPPAIEILARQPSPRAPPFA